MGECARRERYNPKTDVYSYGLLFHQILTLEKPYDDISGDEYDEFVFHNHVRPCVPDELPTRTKRLLVHSWARTISARPSMNIVCQVLKEDRAEIVRFGSPSIASMASRSLSTPAPSSMSYVASCSFSSLSDCYAIKKKTKKNFTSFNINIRTNSSSSSTSTSNNKNNSRI